MKSIEEIRKNPRLKIFQESWDGGNGYIHHPSFKRPMFVIFSWGGGWDHISASFKNKTPTWDEMCIVKDIFFDDKEWAIQYHPAKNDYVNIHPHVLHLWKPQSKEVPTPPTIFV